MAGVDRGWAELPSHLLDHIIEKLSRYSDYMRFRAVCKSWFQVAQENSGHDHKQSLDIIKASHNKLPMLMIHTAENGNDTRGLYSVTEGITYKVRLPTPFNYRFFGSSHGWLFAVDKGMAITLLNPFNGGSISLPIFADPSILYEDIWYENIHDYFPAKGILSSDPYLNPNNYEVLIIYGGMHQLAFYKSGNVGWNFISLQPESSYVFSDVIYKEGDVYAVTNRSQLVKINVDYETVNIIVPIYNVWPAQATYLVESQDGDLLMVTRTWVPCRDYDYINDDDNDDDIHDHDDHGAYEHDDDDDHSHCKTFEIKVFKLVNPIGEGFGNWVQLNNIGKQALFLGDNRSVSISTLEFPNCRDNAIYYTDQYYISLPPYKWRRDDDLGIFSLQDQSFHSHYVMDPSQMHVSPPIWFLPNLKQSN